jgi:hypothetical protein
MGKQVGGRECGQALLQCAASCELALHEYVSGFGLPVEHELFRVLIAGQRASVGATAWTRRSYAVPLPATWR